MIPGRMEQEKKDQESSSRNRALKPRNSEPNPGQGYDWRRAKQQPAKQRADTDGE
jgi:hypothetical protein